MRIERGIGDGQHQVNRGDGIAQPHAPAHPEFSLLLHAPSFQPRGAAANIERILMDEICRSVIVDHCNRATSLGHVPYAVVLPHALAAPRCCYCPSLLLLHYAFGVILSGRGISLRISHRGNALRAHHASPGRNNPAACIKLNIEFCSPRRTVPQRHPSSNRARMQNTRMDILPLCVAKPSGHSSSISPM